MPQGSILKTFFDSLNIGTHIKKNVVPDTVQPSFFNNHLLKVINEEPIIHTTQYEYLIAFILFITFSFFIWLYVRNAKFLEQLVKNYFSNRFGDQVYREEANLFNRRTIVLSLIFLLLLSVFFTKVIDYYEVIEYSNYFLLLLKTAGVLVAIYLVKIISTKTFGFIFNSRKEANELITTIVLFWNVLALFLLPLVICLFFLKQFPAHVFILIGAVGLGIFLMVRFWKTLLIGLNSSRISIFYLFLYLCTLEILPFLILYKVFLINTHEL